MVVGYGLLVMGYWLWVIGWVTFANGGFLKKKW